VSGQNKNSSENCEINFDFFSQLKGHNKKCERERERERAPQMSGLHADGRRGVWGFSVPDLFSAKHISNQL
jgi:hypothetical protein